jgi:asparagine synthase (glutamine-hydrolysing)
MCGISGIISAHISEKDENLVSAIIKNQLARGPDFQSMECIKNNTTEVLFGHNRLAIIDLSINNNQPLWDISHRYCIVFNGEIYNYLELRIELKKLGHSFNTHGDTEVILNAFSQWGCHALTRFQGPFAFALFDIKMNELWLCRDRFGVKPLFYAMRNNVLYFSSTSSVLAKELKLSPDLDYIAQGLKYLVYEDKTSRTAYKQLFSLPASHYLKVKYDLSGQLMTESKLYYQLEDNVNHLIDNVSTYNTENLIEKINDTLTHAIKIRLRADVPVAVALSSGLDSSSIAALASCEHHNIKAFSFGHPYKKKSEGPLVEHCAQFIGISVEYVWPSESEIINAIFKTIEIQDAPFSSLSIVAQYLLYQKVKDANIKVLLGGQGGDEAFMGYKKFLFFSLQHSLKNKHYLAALKKIIALLPNVFSEMPSMTAYWHHRHRYKTLYSDENAILTLPAPSPLSLGYSSDSVWKRQAQDIQHFSLPTLMRYEDRNSMSNSVESRLPFMDHQLIELALALPETMKLHKGHGKWVIRKMMLNKIPYKICMARNKRGFDVSLKQLLNKKLGPCIRSQIKLNSGVCNEFLRKPLDIDNTFSDLALLSQRRFHEAMALLWLGLVMS